MAHQEEQLFTRKLDRIIELLERLGKKQQADVHIYSNAKTVGEIKMSQEKYDYLTKPTGRMKVLPEIGTSYCYIDNEGYTYCPTFTNQLFDLEMFIHGNMYHDRESAEKAKPEYLAWLNSTAKVLSRIAELNPEEWEPDWEDRTEYKYYFIYESDRGKITTDWWSTRYFLPTPHYMATEEIAEQILAEMPEDVERIVRR